MGPHAACLTRSRLAALRTVDAWLRRASMARLSGKHENRAGSSMPLRMARPVCSTIALLCSVHVVAFAAEPMPAPLQAVFAAPVTVLDNGQIEAGDVSGVKGALAEAVRAQLRAIQAVPAKRGEVAVKAEMVVQGRAVLIPTDSGQYSLSLDALAILPPNAVADRAMPPRYPVEMFTRDQAGHVELEVRVDAAGRLNHMRTVSSSHPAFEKAVRAALGDWKFRPSSGIATFAVPVVFRLEEQQRPSVPPKFECVLPHGQAHIVGQSGCVPLIEVTASRRRR